MTKFFTVVGMSAFLVFSGVSVFAGQAGMKDQQGHSEDSPSMKGKKHQGGIESKSHSNQNSELTEEQQKEARPGGVGEEGSTFGSPSTFPPGDTSQGYTGEDQKAEKMERQLEQDKQGM